MHNIAPFAPKIIERTTTRTVIYDTLEDYRRNRLTYLTSHNAHVKCVICEKTFRDAKSAGEQPCTTLRQLPDFTFNRHRARDNGTLFGFARWKTKTVIETRHAHALREVAVVTNELGDDIGYHDIDKRQREAYLRGSGRTDFRPTMEQFLASSWCSPLLRGQLPAERDKAEANDWCVRYRHYPRHMLEGSSWRCMRTTQERRMVDACQVDEFSPAIRGKRSKRNLPTQLDDFYPHRDRTWKRRKVKKQWMVNLG